MEMCPLASPPETKLLLEYSSCMTQSPSTLSLPIFLNCLGALSQEVKIICFTQPARGSLPIGDTCVPSLKGTLHIPMPWGLADLTPSVAAFDLSPWGF